MLAGFPSWYAWVLWTWRMRRRWTATLLLPTGIWAAVFRMARLETIRAHVLKSARVAVTPTSVEPMTQVVVTIRGGTAVLARWC